MTATSERPTPADVAPRRPGRPRSAQVERAILDAALRSLVEVGYAGTSIEGVAARAGVGKTTIYRRWSSKDALAAAALRTFNERVHLPNTGDLRADLVDLLTQFADSARSSAIGPVLERSIAASLEAPELMAIVLENLVLPRRAALAEVARQAQARGELRPDIEPTLLAEVIGATFIGSIIFPFEIDARSPEQRLRILDLLLHGALAPAHR
jgi:AcrR family transcriptional regulator